MDSAMSTISSYMTRLSNELGQIAQRLDGTGWATISALLLICGWFFLKGNKIRST
jgi:hypothetical protein